VIIARPGRDVASRSRPLARRSASRVGFAVSIPTIGAILVASCGKDGLVPDATPDIRPPEILATIPADGTVNVDAGAAIRVRFDEDLDPGSVSSQSLVVMDSAGVVAGAVSYTDAAREVVFSPSPHLAPLAVHTAVVRPGLRDRSGNATADSTRFRFSTGAFLDADGDGYAPEDGDCDDHNPDVNPGAPDSPDDGGTDANCDGLDGNLAASLFVAPGGDDAAQGTIGAPLRTIGAAIQRATGKGIQAVLIARGVYRETLVLPSGVSLFGGYDRDSGWRRDPFDLSLRAEVTTVQLALRAESIDRPTWVESLVLRATTPRMSGESAIAVLARAADSLRLRHLTLVAEGGAPGRSGAPGQPGLADDRGENGAAGCESGEAPCSSCTQPDIGLGGQSKCADGGWGGAPGLGMVGGVDGTQMPGGGAGGAGGPAGSFGLRGGAGSAGGPGAGGAGGDGRGRMDGDGLWRGDAGEPGAPGANGGSGGGGGGGGGAMAVSCPVYGGAGGGGGTGGCGGRGGGGGQGGGGSIALLLVDSSPLVERCVLEAAGGGAGGTGALGGAAGNGGQGGIGGPGRGGGGGGGDGGDGGRGGPGGSGGGGGGGVAFGIYRAASSTPTLSDLIFMVGPGGSGGAGAEGAGNGAAGARGDVW